jgi:hypothetical protein
MGKPQHIELKKLQKTSKEYMIKMFTATKGQVLGLEDAVFDRRHSTTVKCASSHGRLYAIKRKEFIFKHQKEIKTWKHLKSLAAAQDLALSTKAKINKTSYE